VKLAIVTETFPPEINGVALTFGLIARNAALRARLRAVAAASLTAHSWEAIIPCFEADLMTMAAPAPR
jgi:hypothetical protein